MNQKISRLTISADEKSELRQNNVTLIRGHHANKRVYETILDDLRSYDSYSVTLLNELETIKIQITTGLSQIGSSWNASSGTFTIPDDLSWATTLTSLSTSKKSVEDIEKADIINDYMQITALIEKRLPFFLTYNKALSSKPKKKTGQIKRSFMNLIG